MAKSNPKPNSPLGLTPAVRSASRNPVKKVTDNTKGWALVENIPVPPASEKRNFSKPIGAVPVLINGAEPKGDSAGLLEPPQPNKEPTVSTNTEVSFSYQTPTPILAVPLKTVYIEWYGLAMAIDCLNAIYNSAANSRTGQGWLLLELKIDSKLGKPAWLPPIAELDETGKISVPEFYCTVDGLRLKCQMLNVELCDKANEKYVYVLRVLNS